MILRDDENVERDMEIVAWVSEDPKRRVIVVAGHYSQAMWFRRRFRGELYLSDAQIRIVTSAQRLQGMRGPFWLALVGSWQTRHDLSEIYGELKRIRETS